MAARLGTIGCGAPGGDQTLKVTRVAICGENVIIRLSDEEGSGSGKIIMRSIILLIFLLFLSFNALAQSVVYVNDVIRVGVRAKPATDSKKVSVVKTGEVLEVLDSSDLKYYKVKTIAGNVGWVSRTYVSDEQPAFMRLDAMKIELDRLKVNQKLIESQLDLVQEINFTLEGTISRLKEKNVQLQSELVAFKESTIIPGQYQLSAWTIGVLVILALGVFIGVRWVHNKVRSRLGGLDI